jgi:hypothetical protein
MFDCRYQQTRVDPVCPSEENTTAALVVKSWLKVAFTPSLCRQRYPDFSEQVDPGKSKAAITAVLEKLQKTAAAKSITWNNENIDQNLFRRFLGRILIQRSSM